jgi:ABC-type Fe3+-siderophore transport system permease subunit
VSRRACHVTFACAVLAVALLPLARDQTDEPEVFPWVAGVSALSFAFVAVLIAWMWRRMTCGSRTLTVFGAAICDLFAALTALFVLLSAISALAWWEDTRGLALSRGEVRAINWACVAFGGVLVGSTGVVVAIEMRRTERLSVHDEGEAP